MAEWQYGSRRAARMVRSASSTAILLRAFIAVVVLASASSLFAGGRSEDWLAWACSSSMVEAPQDHPAFATSSMASMAGGSRLCHLASGQAMTPRALAARQRVGGSAGVVRLATAVEEDTEKIDEAADTEEEKEPLPYPRNDPTEMVEQASAAVIRAYRAGFTRQTVHLNLELVPDLKKIKENELEPPFFPEVVRTTMPFAQKFTELLQLPGGAPMQGVQATAMDSIGTHGDRGTLFYRSAEQSWQDIAVLYLAGRTFPIGDRAADFLDGMKERLVVLTNPEDAGCPFTVSVPGSVQSAYRADVLEDFCETFRTETYFHKFADRWGGTVIFRVYPHPWTVFYRDPEGKHTLVKEQKIKPRNGEAINMVNEYLAKTQAQTAEE